MIDIVGMQDDLQSNKYIYKTCFT